MKIGEVSRQSGVNIETIRYYERAGILPPANRHPNGRRTYDETDVRRLGFIRHARYLGFDLASVRALLELQRQPDASCAEAYRMAKQQLEAVEGRIALLTDLKSELSRMMPCKQETVRDCSVIAAVAATWP